MRTSSEVCFKKDMSEVVVFLYPPPTYPFLHPPPPPPLTLRKKQNKYLKPWVNSYHIYQSHHHIV